MRNLKITHFMRDAKYSNISKEKLDEFFSSGYNRRLKEKCKNSYNMFDFKQGILIANHLVRLDEDRYIVDLMVYALAYIEDLEKIVADLEEIIKELEEENKSEKTVNNEENEEM